jgi:hypothetical protein
MSRRGAADVLETGKRLRIQESESFGIAAVR